MKRRAAGCAVNVPYATETQASRLGRSLLLASALVAMLAVQPLMAATARADDDADAAAGGANGRALRLSSVEGQVRVEQDGQVLADPALANMPLFAGSQVTTGNDGRTEIQLEDGSVIRLSPNSTLTFPVIEKRGSGTHTEVVLNGGLAYFELQPSTSESSLRVSYGSASFAATSFSVVRITLDTPPGELAVFSGNVHLDKGDSLQLDIHGGESLALDSGNSTKYELHESIQPDSWDTWNADRDQLLNAEASQQTSASGSLGGTVAGMADLDANGNWYDVPGQGYVWSPYDAQTQGASFDPYGYGHWVYYPRYGWVWVSGYGWGYAAFDCGEWNYFDSFGWGWAPGGGCSPWWGGGGWGYNLGNGPRGYRPPVRPIKPPIHPHPVGGRTLVASNVVPVDRRVAGSGSGIYGRPSGPVTIAGRTVEPLKPIAPRQQYDHPGGVVAGARPANGYFPAPSTTYSGVRPVASGGHPVASAPSHASYSGGASHSAPSGGGGGGGGGGHVSSGGGGSHH
jgi:hypothetical protein